MESRPQWAFRTVSDAFADLESLAETIIEPETGSSEADVRLGEHRKAGLDAAFDVLRELVDRYE